MLHNLLTTDANRHDIIDRRVANSLPIVVSSNYPREKVSSDPRIVSRLECAYELKFPPKDLRKAYGLIA